MHTEPGNKPTPPEDSQSPAAKLQAYVEANAGTFTDAAMTAELTRAGYAEEDVRAALARASRPSEPPPKRRAVLTILIAYAVTFAVLSLGMLSNTVRTSGCCMPDATAGIMILAGSLGFALILALAWVGNRRAAALIVALLLGVYGFANLGGGGGFGGVVIIAIAIGLAFLVLRRGAAPTTRSTATLGALLSVPMILLVVIAGLCVATGLPIPHAG